ncbi:MAG: hypothetical protein EBT03_07275 [Betaproteobacteria bacterium]|nr:hypothetical protein [Betaproteobacteria bacterium]
MTSKSVALWAPSEIEYEYGACGHGCSGLASDGADHLGDGTYTVPWECAHGSWLLSTEAPAGWMPGASHSAEIIWDNAEMAGFCVRWLQHRGCLSFGDIVFLEEMRYYAGETPEVRAARKEAEVLRDAADTTRVIVSKVARKEDKWTNQGSMKFRVPRPCRYASLFQQRICANCSTKLPAGTDTCSARIVMVEEQEKRRDGRLAGTGKMVARLAEPGASGVRICGEKLAGCWNHDQHRTCIYVHPDEPQWAAACAGTLRVKEDNRLIFCMAGEERAAVAMAPARFAALGPQGGHGGQRQQGGGQGGQRQQGRGGRR